MIPFVTLNNEIFENCLNDYNKITTNCINRYGHRVPTLRGSDCYDAYRPIFLRSASGGQFIMTQYINPCFVLSFN